MTSKKPLLVQFKRFSPEHPVFVLEGILEAKRSHMIFGPSNIGKSLVAIGISACVAGGQKWFGRRSAKQCVVYAASEGFGGLLARFEAVCRHLNLDIDNNLFLIEGGFEVLNEESVEYLCNEIEQILFPRDEDNVVSGHAPTLIVIDTWAGSLGAGDENSTEDIARAVSILREQFQGRLTATYLIVHHTGIEGGRPRGSTVLNAAMDITLQVARPENDHTKIELSCYKNRDAPKFTPLLLEAFSFFLDVKKNQWGEDVPVSAPVLRLANLSTLLFYEDRKKGIEISYVDALRDIDQGWRGSEQHGANLGISAASFTRSIKRLAEYRNNNDEALIIKKGRGYELTAAGKAFIGLMGSVDDFCQNPV